MRASGPATEEAAVQGIGAGGGGRSGKIPAFRSFTRAALAGATIRHASDAHDRRQGSPPRRQHHQSRRARPRPADGHRQGPQGLRERDRQAARSGDRRDAAWRPIPTTRSWPRKAPTRATIPTPEYVWIIDPLDGTTNFLHGFPQYCVSIALAHKGVVQQGVIYDPVRNDLFTATRGRGAFLNDRRMRVSQAHAPARLPDRHRLSVPRRQLSSTPTSR